MKIKISKLFFLTVFLEISLRKFYKITRRLTCVALSRENILRAGNIQLKFYNEAYYVVLAFDEHFSSNFCCFFRLRHEIDRKEPGISCLTSTTLTKAHR